MSETAAELERLYRELGPDVWHYLRGQTPDVYLAEEVLQETFLAVVARPSGLEAAVSKRAWLVGVARNVLRSHRRTQKRFAARRLDENLPEAAEAETDSRLEAMRKAIARLPAQQREVLELRLAAELAYAEIAEILRIPVGTVRSRLHHAVAALKDWAYGMGVLAEADTPRRPG